MTPKEQFQTLLYPSWFIDSMVNQWLDFCVYSMLQLYFMPATLMDQGTEAEKWISSFSTNGMKNFNICKQ